MQEITPFLVCVSSRISPIRFCALLGIFYDILSIEKVSAFVLSLLGDICELEFGRLGILVDWGLGMDSLLFSIPIQ